MTYILIEKNYDSKNKCFIESSTKITKSNDFRLLAKMQHESNYDYTSLKIKGQRLFIYSKNKDYGNK